jgi:hypothetical protein
MVEPDGTSHHGRMLFSLNVSSQIVTRCIFIRTSKENASGRANWHIVAIGPTPYIDNLDSFKQGNS